MGFFNSFILAATGLAAIFFLYQAIKYQPGIFSKDKLSESFSTMGVLALILIGIVGLVVVLLKH